MSEEYNPEYEEGEPRYSHKPPKKKGKGFNIPRPVKIAIVATTIALAVFFIISFALGVSWFSKLWNGQGTFNQYFAISALMAFLISVFYLLLSLKRWRWPAC